eukprot:2698483-Pyramimonas_sp.AAC.1
MATQRAHRIGFLESHVRSILAVQQLVAEDTGGAAPELPLVIMTGDDTHAATEALLKEHDYFGAAPEQ